MKNPSFFFATILGRKPPASIKNACNKVAGQGVLGTYPHASLLIYCSEECVLLFLEEVLAVVFADAAQGLVA